MFRKRRETVASSSPEESEDQLNFATPAAATPVAAVRRDLRPSALKFQSPGQDLDNTAADLDDTVRPAAASGSPAWPPGRSPAGTPTSSTAASTSTLLAALPRVNVDRKQPSASRSAIR